MASLSRSFPVTKAPFEPAYAKVSPIMPDLAACGIGVSKFSVCELATPNLPKLPLSRQASCLCYSDSTWAPQEFDSAVASCKTFLSKIDPAYSSLALLSNSAINTFCLIAGNVRHVDATMTGPGTIPAGLVSTEIACSKWIKTVASCDVATPGFSLLPWAQQASCACYSNGNYKPGAYDSIRSTCVDWFSRTIPLVASKLTSGTYDVGPTPCQSIGNVRKTPASTQPQPISSNAVSAPSKSLVTKMPNRGARKQIISVTKFTVIILFMIYLC